MHLLSYSSFIHSNFTALEQSHPEAKQARVEVGCDTHPYQ